MIWIISGAIAFMIIVALTKLLGKKGNYKNDGTEI
jgi:hypothetical protein